MDSKSLEQKIPPEIRALPTLEKEVTVAKGKYMILRWLVEGTTAMDLVNKKTTAV